MTTDTSEYHFHRALPLPPDQLWHLLTDGRMRERWGAPSAEMTLTLVTEDLRAGGIERHRCGPKDNPEFEVETRWYHLSAPTDAVFTETVEIGGDALGTSLVTYRVSPNASGSDLQITVAVSSFTGPDTPGEFQKGWEGGLSTLETLAASVAAA